METRQGRAIRFELEPRNLWIENRGDYLETLEFANAFNAEHEFLKLIVKDHTVCLIEDYVPLTLTDEQVDIRCEFERICRMADELLWDITIDGARKKVIK